MTTATESRELPILFKGPMVRAILEGTKTQTRRVVKPQRAMLDAPRSFPAAGHDGEYGFLDSDGNWYGCPYGQPGDLLYVRETWRVHRSHDALKPKLVEVAMGGDTAYCIDYQATPHDPGPFAPTVGWGKWRPSIFMPKSFSRIWLRVNDVRVERVQEITHDDAIAEGLTLSDTRTSWEVREQHARVPFARLWDSINADRGHPWESNPWVWVVAFERAEAP